MTTLPNTPAVFCGWGTPGTDGFIPFSILRDDTTLSLPDWALAPRITVDPIPGGDRVVVQMTGMNVATITYRLWFDNPDDYARLVAALGTVGTLNVIYGQQTLAGTDWEEHGTLYTALDNVLLTALGANAVRYPSGPMECDAAFVRTVNRATRTAVTS